ncbi:type III pantothenate kinase [Actimicrobium antarcticum]|uniref:Type III pantothenate kinase n=1 Tax=Actimicrobium antarcticum TaxID=1051899 RepID=A0ABP7T675_9BURK
MLLLVDAGNTRIKWALVDPHRALPKCSGDGRVDAGWLASGAVLQADVATLAQVWQHCGANRVVVANVAGPAVRERLAQLLHDTLGVTPQWFTSSANAAGLRNGYRNPLQLGCDRFASMIGARALFPAQALLVVTCGTATTIDAVSAAGDFMGGMILPGLGLMATSLARHTAQLPQIGAAFVVPPLFADNTDDAILSGCLSAQAGAIERALAAHPGARCILSGGAAVAVMATLSVPMTHVDNLVLLGLQATHLSAPSC